MDNPEELTVLSLCTGYGGLELGLSRVLENPLRVVAVEVEAYALANLVAKAEEGKLAIEALYPDLKTFPAERFSGCFDFVLAGYPCQSFSVVGKRAGAEDPRHLWPHISRIIATIRPVFGFFENVPGHLSLGFPEVYRSLRDMGYEVEAGLFTAAECGAPHKRQRLFILAHADRQGSQEPRPSRLRTTQSGIISRWPARPGQPQYEWEEPRVIVGNARSDIQRRQQRGLRKETGESLTDTGEPREIGDHARGSSERGNSEADKQRRSVQSGDDRKGLTIGRPSRQPGTEAQSIVGRAIDGPASRVDAVAQQLGSGYCAKVTTIATIITKTGEQIMGYNACMTPQETCPRKPSDDYAKCRTICGQIGHAEVVACSLAGSKAKGATLYLQGHTYCCDNCLDVMSKAGIYRHEIVKSAKTNNRVDRLRLCGNGVVPQQAEKAFRELRMRSGRRLSGIATRFGGSNDSRGV